MHVLQMHVLNVCQTDSLMLLTDYACLGMADTIAQPKLQIHDTGLYVSIIIEL